MQITAQGSPSRQTGGHSHSGTWVGRQEATAPSQQQATPSLLAATPTPPRQPTSHLAPLLTAHWNGTNRIRFSFPG